MIKWEFKIAAMAAGTLFHGQFLEAALIHEPDGWLRSTNAVEHVHTVNRPLPGPNIRPAYILSAEFETLQGPGSAVLTIGNNPTLPAMTWTACGEVLTSATMGDFTPDAIRPATGAIALRATLQPSATRARLTEEITLHGQTQKTSRSVPLSAGDAASGFGGFTLKMSGEMRARVSLTTRQTSLFLIR